ncbi:MAG: hypothetical protein RO469_11740 [Thermincola sp.]|jgi:hypothetical protein|nr:hypothetical protein [Thermincola sp.]MDT3703768.1 hypothetical protein [Thermincola sp.]
MNAETKEFYLDAISRVRNFVEYEMYQKNKTKAINSLKKKYPDISIQQCTEIFDSLFLMFKETVEFVGQHQQYYWDLYHKEIQLNDSRPALTDFETNFYKRFKEIPSEIMDWTISWVFFWHHLK